MSNDKAIARVFKLWAKISMMVVDGKRNATQVADVLQHIIIEPRYRTFEIWKKVTIGFLTCADEVYDLFDKAYIRIDSIAVDFIKQVPFENVKMTFNLVSVTNAQLGLTKDTYTVSDVIRQGYNLGLIPCLPEVALQLMMQYRGCVGHQRFAMRPLIHDGTYYTIGEREFNDNPVIAAEHYYLRLYNSSDSKWIFMLPKS